MFNCFESISYRFFFKQNIVYLFVFSFSYLLEPTRIFIVETIINE